MKLETLDRSFATDLNTIHPETVFYNVHEEPFRIYGAAEPDGFNRLPESVRQHFSKEFNWLAGLTAGVRVRFSTNSPYVVLCVKVPGIHRQPLFASSACSGFDLYRKTDLGYAFVTGFSPDFTVSTGFTIERPLSSDGKMRDYVLNFPLCNLVTDVWLGFAPDAVVAEGSHYLYDKPVVYYGSSITQGGNASRPGNTYEAIISRRYDLDYVNLGFAGNARGEQVLAEWISTLDMTAFVCDYDHNAGSPKDLEDTAYPFYETVRKKQPDVPYFMISRPDFEKDYAGLLTDSEDRRAVVMEAYLRARKTGDRNVYFIDGFALFAGENRDTCTTDGTHPNDMGFERMANLIGATLKMALIR